MSPGRPVVTVHRWQVGVALATIAAGPLLAVAVGGAYLDLADCLKDKTAADARRTAALAGPTDRERAAERMLLEPGGDPRAEAAAVREARAAVDRARAAYPPPTSAGC